MRDGGKGEIRILVTGGGTGGHVGPALAVVQTLREMAGEGDRKPVFQYVGSAQGIEKRLAEEAGIPFLGVQSGKLRRSSRLLGLLSARNVGDLFRVPLGIGQSLGAVRRFRPDVAFSTGGYVSVPPALAAALSGVPLLVHEQTVTIGLANRIVARVAERVALTFEGALDELPPGVRAKSFVSGNPVRAEIFGGDRARAATRFGFASDDLPTVYVTGGAQGARILNRALETVLPDLLAICRVLHQCGRQPEGSEQDYDRLQFAANALPADLRRRYHVARFINQDEIGDAYAIADLVVGRSGAGTVTEVCALGKPAIFVPLVPTGGDEQTRNAQRSVDAGAAVILPNAECDGPRLARQIAMLLADGNRRVEMGRLARTLARPDAARDLARTLLEMARPA